MNKNKKIIILLVSIIILLCGIVGYLTYKLSKKDLSNKEEIKTGEKVKNCQSNYDYNCIHYEANGFKIESKPSSTQKYYINGKSIGIYKMPEVEQVIDNKYIIIDLNKDNTKYDTMFDLNGNEVEFDTLFKYPDSKNMSFSNNKLTIEYMTEFDPGDDHDNNYLCIRQALDSIFYLKQEVEYSNGKFGTPKTIKSTTYGEELKEANIDC